MVEENIIFDGSYVLIVGILELLFDLIRCEDANDSVAKTTVHCCSMV